MEALPPVECGRAYLISKKERDKRSESGKSVTRNDKVTLPELMTLLSLMAVKKAQQLWEMPMILPVFSESDSQALQYIYIF